MKTPTKIHRITAPATAVALVCLLASTISGRAANRTWTNAPTDGNWSTAANWVEGVAPVTTDTLFFGNSSLTSVTNDLGGPPFIRGINYAIGGDAFTLGGNAFVIDANITNSSANAQVINMDATLNFDRNLNGVPNFTFGGLFLNSGGNRAFYNRLDGGTLSLNNVTLSEAAATVRTLTIIGSASGSMAQANTTISGVVANGSTAGSTLQYFGTGTLKFNGSAPSTYTGASSITAGTLLLDFANMATPENLLNNASTLTLGGGTYSLLGKSSGTTFQTNGNLTLTANTGSGITLNNNGGSGTTLKTGNWTRNGNSTLLVDTSAGGTLAHGATAPGTANGILNPAYGTVKDSTGTGFATVSGGNVVRYTGATALADNSDNFAVNYSYAADGTTFNWNNGITTRAVNSLAIDTTANGGTLDLGGAANVVSNSSRGILMTGGNHFTIQNGQLGSTNTEVIIHVMGAGVLTNKATIGGSGTGSLTKGGPGTLVLAAANNYSNGTFVTEGTLKLGAANALGAPDRVLQVGAGGVLDLNGNNLSVGYIGGNGGGVIVNNGASAATLYLGSNNVASSGGTTYTIVDGASPLNLVKVGTAQVQLSGASSWGGGITVSGGSSTALRVNNSAGLGVGTITLNDGGIFTPSGNPMAGGNGQTLLNTNYNIVGNSANNRLQNDINGFTYIGSFTGSGTVKVDENTRANGNANFTGDFTAFTGTFNVANLAATSFEARLTQVGSASTKFALTTTGSRLNFNGPVTSVALGELSGVASTTVLGDTPAKTMIIGALNTSSTFGGVVANGNVTVSVTKTGSGVLTLGSAATYTGNTVVSNGLLFVNGLNSTNVNVVAPGSFGGAGTVAGPVTLSSGNAGLLLTNGTTGTLNIGNGTVGLVLDSGNRLAFDVGTTPTSDTVAVNGPLTQAGTAMVYISQAAGFGAGTFTLMTAASGISSNNFTLGTTLPGYNMSITDDGAGTTLFLNVSISAPAAAFWHNRSGTTWNTAANWDDSQSGNIQLATVPSSPTDVTFSADLANNFNTTLGANMAIHNLVFNTPSTVTVGGANTLTISGNVAVNSGSGNHTISASGVTLGVDQSWTVTDIGQTLAVSAPVGGAKSLTIAGAGTVALSGNNSYSAGTLVKDTATLALNHASDTLANAGAVAVDGGTLSIGANSDVVGAVTLTNGAIVGSSGVLTGSVYYVENGTISARLGGTAALTKANIGTVLVSGNNSFSGGASIGNGTLQLGSSTALGTGSATVVSGATLDLNGQTNTTVTSVNGAGYSGAGAIANSSTNAAAILSEIGNGQAYTVNATGDITLLRTRSVGGPFTVTKTGPGTVTFGTPASASHNNLMALMVSQGTAVLNMPGFFSVDRDPCGVDTGATLQLAGTGGNQINDGSTVTLNTGGLFDMNGRSELIGSLVAAAGSLTTNSQAASNSVLNIGGGNGGAATGTCQVDGEIAGGMGLGKFGTGTMTMTASNTYSGTTTVGAGSIALSVDGSIGHSTNINIVNGATLDVTARTDGTLTLNSGQTLMGNGTVSGNLVTASNSTVNPGASVGTLNVANNITLGGKLLLELDTATVQTNDKLVSVGGTITYGGTLLVTNIGPALQVSNVFQLFPSAVTAFTGISLATTDTNGYTYTWTNRVAIDGSIMLLSATPPITVDPNPTNIIFSVSGSTLTLSWPASHIGWTLQTQTNSRSIGLTVATNTWYDVAGSVSTNLVDVPINKTNPTVFFRLRLP